MKHIMKNYLAIFFTLIICFSIAQEPADELVFPESATSDTMVIRPFGGRPGMLPFDPDKKVTLRLEMGTTFGLSSGAATLFGVYTAPHVSYKVSDRWRLNFGARIQNTNFLNYYSPFNPYFPEFTQTFENNITQTLLYVESEYMLHPRLMISTRAFKEVSVFDQPQVNPRVLDLNSEGVSVGFNYRLTENLHFGAEFGYSKGRNPYNPFFNPMHGFSGRNHYGIAPLSPFNPAF
jgi:hypothetical protein